MLDLFLMIGLPYAALIGAIAGGMWRYRQDRFSFSARSSQFLESRQLRLGSGAWHVGILIVLLGHLFTLLLPGFWAALVSVPAILLLVEVGGMAAALLSLVGLILLLVRRIRSRHVQAVTTTADLIVVLLLIAQVGLGLVSSLRIGHGAVWATGTVVPYLWGLVTFRPDLAYVVDFPILFKLHLIGAWLLLLLFPFTRLVHIVSVPLDYLWRAPQLVNWAGVRRQRHAVEQLRVADSRRAFLKGSVGVAGAGALLALGVSEKAANYFRGPAPDPEAETELLQKKLVRLQQTAEERALELERERSALILVAPYAELSEQKGKYFIDYAMAPGLAFRGADGLPILRSAKCTHLGCTVGSDIDADGRILCPCHVSYFDVKTGQPNAGAPAKLPLPELGWALLDGSGSVVTSKAPGGDVRGVTDPQLLATCTLYITRPAVA
ncbi:MAG: respiratory nitrate reductase subunit gamma [Candidatus Eisenbacteria bacterium]|nr:respiratory nitrate reductase subunit gamma [Candidatus Eisenbacteria bacterium]